MNLKSIMTSAAVAALAVSLSSVSFAQSCTFVRATKLSEGCWEREDSCGGASYIGGHCYTSYPRRVKAKKAKKNVKAQISLPAGGTVFVADVPTCAKGAA
jgi:hypothetical protein